MRAKRDPGSVDTAASEGGPTEVVAELSPTEKPVPLSASIVLVATLGGVVAAWVVSGLAATWFNLPVEVWAFLLVWAGTTGYVSFESVPSAVVARGFALGAALVVLEPVFSFAPAVLGGEGERAATAAFDLLVWGVGAAVVAGVLLLVARRLSRRAARLERGRARRKVKYHR